MAYMQKWFIYNPSNSSVVSKSILKKERKQSKISKKLDKCITKNSLIQLQNISISTLNFDHIYAELKFARLGIQG